MPRKRIGRVGQPQSPLSSTKQREEWSASPSSRFIARDSTSGLKVEKHQSKFKRLQKRKISPTNRKSKSGPFSSHPSNYTTATFWFPLLTFIYISTYLLRLAFLSAFPCHWLLKVSYLQQKRKNLRRFLQYS